MQDSIKISDIASDLGYESEEIIKKALELGIDAKNTTSRVSTEDAEAIFEICNRVNKQCSDKLK